MLTETDDESAFDVTPTSIEDGRNDRLGVEVGRLTTKQAMQQRSDWWNGCVGGWYAHVDAFLRQPDARKPCNVLRDIDILMTRC